jgi:hypothetical protein
LNTESIGATGTRATVDAWVAAHSSPVDDQTGELLAQDHASNVTIDGATPGIYQFHLTAAAGAEHDGRHHAKSGLGNARISANANVITCRAYIQSLRISWVEFDGPGNFNQPIIRVTAGSGDNNFRLDHCIIHNNAESTGNDQHGINCEAAVLLKIYRNIVFGCGGSGIWCLSAAVNSAFLYNTFFGNRRSNHADAAGITNVDNDVAIRGNALFENNGQDLYTTNGTLNYNYTDDDSGDDEGAQGVANLDPALQFVTPTTTWANLDLTPLETAALHQAGTTENTTTYPEINYPVNDRATPITGNYDIGAGYFFSVGGGATSEGVATGRGAASTLSAKGAVSLSQTNGRGAVAGASARSNTSLSQASGRGAAQATCSKGGIAAASSSGSGAAQSLSGKSAPSAAACGGRSGPIAAAAKGATVPGSTSGRGAADALSQKSVSLQGVSSGRGSAGGTASPLASGTAHPTGTGGGTAIAAAVKNIPAITQATGAGAGSAFSIKGAVSNSNCTGRGAGQAEIAVAVHAIALGLAFGRGTALATTLKGVVAHALSSGGGVAIGGLDGEPAEIVRFTGPYVQSVRKTLPYLQTVRFVGPYDEQ